MGKLKLLHTNPINIDDFEQVKCQFDCIKSNMINTTILIIIEEYYSGVQIFSKVLCYDYSKFGIKITICYLGSITVH